MTPKSYAVFVAFSLWSVPFLVEAAPLSPDPEFDRLLSLDIAELVVTSVSKREQQASRAAAAIYVLTQKDLHQAGVTTIPEALRMVPGVQVAQTGSHAWAVSVRGFNNVLANKLLVLIDGRAIYTPVYSGVYWDTQDTLIEDIDRIEVIRGPGATLWGANAVNGVINIVTKKASETQGTYVAASAGTKEYQTVEGRYGGAVDKNTHYRVYAKEFRHGSLDRRNNTSGYDEWSRLYSGFRLDKTLENDSYTAQGDIYGGAQQMRTSFPILTAPYTQTGLAEDNMYGGNALMRWNHTVSERSSTSLQMFVDHYSRDELLVEQHVTTLDVDFQHVIKTTDRNELIWGGGVRHISELLNGSQVVNFAQESSSYSVFNGFLQNQYALIPDKLFFILGSKVEHNEFTGIEVQPSGRLSWAINGKQTAWAAVSRAVRVPSRVEDDLTLLALATPGTSGNPPNAYYVIGNSQIDSEELMAYELGYRISPVSNVSVDISTFYNVYDNLTVFRSNGAPFLTSTSRVLPYSYDNLGQGRVYGAETSVNWNVTEQWQLAAGYNYMLMHLRGAADSISNFTATERVNPKHQFSLRSHLDLRHNLNWNNMLYYVHDLTIANNTRHLPANLRFDSRLEWKPLDHLELSVIGRNLFNADHSEFSTTEVGPSVIGTVAWRF